MEQKQKVVVFWQKVVVGTNQVSRNSRKTFAEEKNKTFLGFGVC